MTKIIGVVSLKGGVGKTSAVVALGSAMSEFGKKVLLVDGNLSSPSLGLHLNVVDPKATLHNVLNRTAQPKDAIYKIGKLDVMPASLFENGEVNPLLLKDKIRSLKKSYDVILLDSSPNLDEETLGVILASDQIITVTTPDHPTLSATIKAAKLAKQRGTPISGIVLNKVHDKNFEVALRDVEEVLDLPVLAVIPYDTRVLSALSSMEPSTLHAPKSAGSIEYKKLAATLLGQKYDPFSFRSFFGFAPRQEEINREIFYDNVFK